MTELWYQKSQADELKPVPWMHPDVVAYLESLLSPDMKVIEHGSGGSTLWLAPRVRSVASIETDPDWYEKVSELAPGNAVVRLVSPGYKPGKLSRCDLLLIDGMPLEDRCLWIEAAPKLVKPGGWVVLDNANRPHYASERERLVVQAESVKRFNGNVGETRYLVTDFFHMPGDAP